MTDLADPRPELTGAYGDHADPGALVEAPELGGEVPVAPSLPAGRYVDLAGRGTTFLRECQGPEHAPTILLLHGWTATADLNWFPHFAELGRRYHVVAPDHRGHGRGIRSREPFTLEAAADDAVAVLDALHVQQAIVVGYSMGGAIAQLVWRRHRERVTGLVLGATARSFSENLKDTAMFALLTGATFAGRRLPQSVSARVGLRVLGSRRGEDALARWAAVELRRHDWKAVAEAGRCIGRFSSEEWSAGIDVPAVVIATLTDDVVDPIRQLRLARTVPTATVRLIEGNHGVCATDPHRFQPLLLDAISEVRTRAAGHHAGSGVAIHRSPRAAGAVEGDDTPVTSGLAPFSVWRAPSPGRP